MIVVFGALTVDILLQVKGLPKPGETVLTDKYVLMPGGKGANQACAAALAGKNDRKPVHFIGTTGDDDFGVLATSVLVESDVDIRHTTQSKSPTAVAAVGIEPTGENAIIVATGANLDSRAEQVSDELLTSDTWLVLQMEVPLAENWALIERAKARETRIVLNVAPAVAVPKATLACVDLLIVNEVEAKMLARGEIDAAAAARQIAAISDCTCIVTLGAKGARAYEGDGGWSIGALPIIPVDTTGAGDAFVGVLVAALDGGFDLAAALHRASVGAGLACTKIGCQSAFRSHSDINHMVAELAPPKRFS